jgi:nucleoside-triphosphatase THEP1
MSYKLSEKWIKASITGTIWAASEIVLGSFLHNLKVPFSGNILTAIGLVILISISYTWTEKGLFWRAGLVCALMKTMSPSAVIFGPMIAIFTESFLLELSVRLLGSSVAGYAIGSMLAMSWNLVQKILNYIIFYGSDIIQVYSDLLKFAQKQLAIKTDIVWMPIIALLIVYAIFGLLAAIIGIKVGRKLLSQPLPDIQININKQSGNVAPITGQVFNYSIAWLCADIALIIFSFILLNMTTWIVWSLTISGIVIVWTLRYKRALRQLSKPKFWIFFVFITLLTAFVFTKAQPGENSLVKGLLTGVQMNFRAVVIIVGFSVLGTELYNPVVRKFFMNTTFKNLPLALELSAESLPLFVANIPDFKSLLRNPVSVFYQVISHADRKLTEINGNATGGGKVFIVTGSIRGGKTTYTKELIDILQLNNIEVAGILSERVMEGTLTTGYNLVNIETGAKEDFLRQDEDTGEERIGRFRISEKGLAAGREILNSLLNHKQKFVIIDEVGMLELQDKGWAEDINNLLRKSSNHILITVRDIYIEEVKKKWDLAQPTIFNISESDHLVAGKAILKQINLLTVNPSPVVEAKSGTEQNRNIF